MARTHLRRLGVERKTAFLASGTNLVFWDLLLQRCSYFALLQAGGAPLSFSPGFGFLL